MSTLLIPSMEAFICGLAIGILHWIAWYLWANKSFQSLIDKELNNSWGKMDGAFLKTQFFLPWLVVVGGVYGALKLLSFPVLPVCLGIVVAVSVGLIFVVLLIMRHKQTGLRRAKEEK